MVKTMIPGPIGVMTSACLRESRRPDISEVFCKPQNGGGSGQPGVSGVPKEPKNGGGVLSPPDLAKQLR